MQELFKFAYRWEVYKPAAARQYGYYVLPVLYGDRFAARFEPGRDQESGGLIIKNWWWENGFKQTKASRKALIRCFRRFLAFLGTGILLVDVDTARWNDLEWLHRIDRRKQQSRPLAFSKSSKSSRFSWREKINYVRMR